jgi:hypothetical protein
MQGVLGTLNTFVAMRELRSKIGLRIVSCRIADRPCRLSARRFIGAERFKQPFQACDWNGVSYPGCEVWGHRRL